MNNYLQFQTLPDAPPTSTARILFVKFFISSFNSPHYTNFNSKTMYGIAFENNASLIFSSRLVVRLCAGGWETLALIVVCMQDDLYRSAS
jgi:hypothetical protein